MVRLPPPPPPPPRRPSGGANLPSNPPPPPPPYYVDPSYHQHYYSVPSYHQKWPPPPPPYAYPPPPDQLPFNYYWYLHHHHHHQPYWCPPPPPPPPPPPQPIPASSSSPHLILLPPPYHHYAPPHPQPQPQPQPSLENETPRERRTIDHPQGAHSTSAIIESLDSAMPVPPLLPPQPTFHSAVPVPESGRGNLDLPPSPPPLPLVSESMAPDTINEMGPPVDQITDEPPVKKSRTIPHKPDQSTEVCQIEVESEPVVDGAAEIDCHGEEQMVAPQTDLNCCEDEVSDQSRSETAPHKSVTSNLETPNPPASDAIAAIGQIEPIFQETPLACKMTQLPRCSTLRRTVEAGPSQPTQTPPANPSIILHLPASQHRSSTITNDGSFEAPMVFIIRYQRVVMPYDKQMEGHLKALRLYHVARMGHVDVDMNLITALMERWRPETHTFHLPVGEMTVTLQDVACLWGLPITGQPIIGYSDKDWRTLIAEDLGRVPDSTAWKIPLKRDEPDERVRDASRYCLKLGWLRQQRRCDYNWLDGYTRAYIMDLFGSIMFPDGSREGVPAMYLQFLRDLKNPPAYNWGGAVLAFLYRTLDRCCRSGVTSCAGPLMLLQMWSWTRFGVCRPTSKIGAYTDWGVPDLHSCMPFGRHWTGRETHGSRLSVARDELEGLRSNLVVWQPYAYDFSRLPSLVQADRDMWLARVPLIHFWIVSWHYPDRVMRQFGQAQPVPPPLPQPWDEHVRLDRWEHSSSRRYNWRARHARYVDMWATDSPHLYLVQSDGLYDPSTRREYMVWFNKYGMRTVYPDRLLQQEDDDPGAQPTELVNALTYIPDSARQGLRAFHDAMLGIKMVFTQGWKRTGKQLLRSCRGHLTDAHQPDKLDHLLTSAGLPLDIESIPDDSPDRGPVPHINLQEEQLATIYQDPTRFLYAEHLGTWVQKSQ